MRDIITKRHPDHGIFGEEEGMQQPKMGDDQYLWVLDPIDGTKSFITGKPSDLKIDFVTQLLSCEQCSPGPECPARYML